MMWPGFKWLGRSEKPEAKRSYDAATPARTRFGGGAMRFNSYGPETAAANVPLRQRTRHVEQNNGTAASAVAAWTDAAVGAGIRPTSQHPDAETRRVLDLAFKIWAERADVTGRGNFWTMQANLVRAERIDGEAFVRWVGDQLAMLPPELIADESTDTAVSGIELDDLSRAVGYWLHNSRPDLMSAQYAPPVMVDAAEIMHVFEQRGAGQVRGISALAPVLLALSELDATEDALLTQTKIAALLSVILTNSGDLGGEDPLPDGVSLEPGAILKLAGNWQATTIAPQQSQQAGDFLNHLTRRIAAGVGVPVHLVDGNLTQANYSSLRAALVAFRQRIERYQFQVLVPQFLNPVWRRVATLAALERGIEINEDLFAVEWIAPPMPGPDPAKEADAILTQLKAGLTSRRRAVAELGWSIEELNAEIAADRADAERLGLSFGEQKGIQS